MEMRKRTDVKGLCPTADGGWSVCLTMDENRKGNSGVMSYYSHNQNLGLDRSKDPKL